MRIRSVHISIATACCAAAACGSPADAFVRGRSYNPCVQAIPACPGGITAACTLDGSSFTQAVFPNASPLRFLVVADEGTKIELRLFIDTQRDPGSDTRVYWNEPGCSDARLYKSHGKDLFEEAGRSATLSRAEIIDESGDHLIEILTDMQAVVLLAVTLHDP